MATDTAEFLHHLFRHRLRPASHYSMGFLPLWLALGQHAPRLANRALASPLAPLVKKLGGIAPQRGIPELATPNLRQWWNKRPARTTTADRIVLFPDTFTNHFDPQIADAAVRVLERAGLRVAVPDQPVCCGLTWISTGQLRTARRVLRRTFHVLRPWIEAGTPVVGLEPSCTAVFRSDLRELLPNDEDANRLESQVTTLAEALARHGAAGWAEGRAGDTARGSHALVQQHCHQHAVLGFGPDAEVLRGAGVRPEVLDSGCCGVAGNFGFERGHYDVSMACGEHALLPAVRDADPDSLVVADGFSCRTQIAHGTERRARHLAEVLDARL